MLWAHDCDDDNAEIETRLPRAPSPNTTRGRDIVLVSDAYNIIVCSGCTSEYHITYIIIIIIIIVMRVAARRSVRAEPISVRELQRVE
jgi:hypothetical protein